MSNVTQLTDFRSRICRRAVKRVKNPLPVPTECRYCQGTVRLANNSEVYGRSYGSWPYLYLCENTQCRAYVGLHPRTDIPLGSLADARLREARKNEKRHFDRLWRPGPQAMFSNRSEAYSWLADKLEIPLAACHWAWFDLARCRKAGQICQQEAAGSR